MTANETPPRPWIHPDVLRLVGRWLGEAGDDPHFARAIEVNARSRPEVWQWLLAIGLGALSVSATSGLEPLPLLGLVVTMTYLAHAGPPERKVTGWSILVVFLGALIGWFARNGEGSRWLQYALLLPLLLAMLAAGLPSLPPGHGTVLRLLRRWSVGVNAGWILGRLFTALVVARAIRGFSEWRAWKAGQGPDPDEWDVEFDCPGCLSDADGIPERLRTWPTLRHPRWVPCPRCGTAHPTTERVSLEATRAAALRRLERRRTNPLVLLVLLDRRRKEELVRVFRIERRFDPRTGTLSPPGGELPVHDGPAIHATMPFHDPAAGSVWGGDADAVVAVVPATPPGNGEAERWNDVEIALASVECAFDSLPARRAGTLDQWAWTARALRHLATPARRPTAAGWWYGPPPVLAVWDPEGGMPAPVPEHRGRPVACLRSPGDLHPLLSRPMDTVRADITPHPAQGAQPCLTD